MTRILEHNRVLVVTSSYPEDAEDHRARFVHEASVALGEAGAEVRVVTPASPGAAEGVSLIDGIWVERFGYPGSRSRPLANVDGIPTTLRRNKSRALLVPPFLHAFRRATARAVRGFQPTLMVVHWLIPGAICAASADARVPVVAVAHGSDVMLLDASLVGRVIARQLARRVRVLATSEFLARRLRRMGLSPSVCELGVRTVAPALGRTLSKGAPIRCASMGRFVEGKGFGELIRAFRSAPQARLTIAGAGPLRPSMMAAIADLGLRDRVSLVEPVVGEAKQRFLEAHDVFVFPGMPEPSPDNLPVVVLEALATGMPVIATRVGALPELLGRGGGLLLDRVEEAFIAQSLDHAKDRYESMASLALETGARFRWPRFVAQTASLAWDGRGAGPDKGLK